MTTEVMHSESAHGHFLPPALPHSNLMPDTCSLISWPAISIAQNSLPRPRLNSGNALCRKHSSSSTYSTIEASDGEGSDISDCDRAFICNNTNMTDAGSYVYEHGRRYHGFKAGQYLMPNDEPEQDREDMKNEMIMTLCDNRLHFAPLENPQEILDIATGTGIWAMNMGDQYPSASVLGVDLSPIQPVWVPPNVKFTIDDAEADWTYAADHFDYIHARHIAMAIKDESRMLQQCYTHLKPGGWVELQELVFTVGCDDDSMTADYPLRKWMELQHQGLLSLGIDLTRAGKKAKSLEAAGFTDIHEKRMKVPIGAWPKNPIKKKVGAFMRTVIYDGLQAVSLKTFTKGLGWSVEELELFLVDVRRSLTDRQVHSYIWFHVTIGKKMVGSS